MLELNNIYAGDCLDLLPQLADATVNLICCDLPFGTTNTGKGRNTWDQVIPMDKLWEQYQRVLKPKGIVVLNAMQPFTSYLVCSNHEWFKYELIWKKAQGTGFLNAKKQPLRNHESILIFYGVAGGTYNPQMRTGFKPYKIAKASETTCYGTTNNPHVISESDGDRYPLSVLEFNHDKEKYHPTQKPLALCEWLIKTYSNEGDVVLDNCAGSGSTLLAAKNLKRSFIGIEKDTKFYDVARIRLGMN